MRCKNFISEQLKSENGENIRKGHEFLPQIQTSISLKPDDVTLIF